MLSKSYDLKITFSIYLGNISGQMTIYAENNFSTASRPSGHIWTQFTFTTILFIRFFLSYKTNHSTLVRNGRGRLKTQI